MIVSEGIPLEVVRDPQWHDLLPHSFHPFGICSFFCINKEEEEEDSFFYFTLLRQFLWQWGLCHHVYTFIPSCRAVVTVGINVSGVLSFEMLSYMLSQDPRYFIQEKYLDSYVLSPCTSEDLFLLQVKPLAYKIQGSQALTCRMLCLLTPLCFSVCLNVYFHMCIFLIVFYFNF